MFFLIKNKWNKQYTKVSAALFLCLSLVLCVSALYLIIWVCFQNNFLFNFSCCAGEQQFSFCWQWKQRNQCKQTFFFEKFFCEIIYFAKSSDWSAALQYFMISMVKCWLQEIIGFFSRNWKILVFMYSARLTLKVQSWVFEKYDCITHKLLDYLTLIFTPF